VQPLYFYHFLFKGHTMNRYKLTDYGIQQIHDFAMEHGAIDYMDCYLSEAESIASHAFANDMPALLTVESFSDDSEFMLALPIEWFTVKEKANV